MNKLITHIFILTTSIVLSGCQSQSIATTTEPRVSVVGQQQYSKYPFEAKEVIYSINSGGFIEAQVNGFNHKHSYSKLEYRVDWLDSKGILVYSSRHNQWTEFPVFRNQTFSFVVVAPNPKATDFKIYIRDPKQNSYNIYSTHEGEIE
jgi:uncharacterized protein YcfL